MTTPTYESGVNHLDIRVYETDRNNVRRDLIDHTEIHVDPDWDIDRAGSKGRVDVTASADVLKPGMWIAPYQVIIPETGDIVEQQMGHFRLGRPGAVFDDMIRYDGAHRHTQEAFGSDIVDDLAAVLLPQTFYTPVNGDVMQDVRVLIKIATAGMIGPSILTNGSFENDGAGWSGPFFEGGATGAVTWVDPDLAPPDGKRIYRPHLYSSSPVGSNVYITQEVPLPTGAQFMYLSAIARSASTGRVRIRLNFRDADNATLSSVNREWQGVVNTAYARQIMFEPVPPGTAFVRVYLFSIQDVAGQAGTFRWDDIRLGTSSGLPIPDSRINLPPSSAVATTRIQSTMDSNILYDAINNDRLAAIGHVALFADRRDGTLTTMPSRNVSTATPARRYIRSDIRDYRIIGQVEMPPSDGNEPNHFRAIKESFDDNEPTLWADSYNTNPNDAFSIVNTERVISATPIMLPDAVNQAALQAAADAARDRQSMQEELHIRVLPDPDLMVHDVIEIDDPTMPGVSGKWLVKYLRPGMRPEDPLLEIVLRRAYTGGLS